MEQGKPRTLPERDYLTIKAAFRQGVKLAGGPKLFAATTRGTPSHISEWGSPDHMDRWPPADVMADVDAEAGDPIMARTFADLAGCDLVPRETKPLASVRSLIAAVTREIADIPAKYIEAQADHCLSEKERIAIRLEADQAIDKLNALRAALAPERHVRAVS
jgi:hypothetical protein